MEEKVLMDEAYAQVTYHPELKIGKILWKKKPEIEEYKLPFIKLLDYGKTNQIDSFLSDIRNQGVVSPDNRKWFENEALPQAINECKLKRAAVVFDGNIFKQYYLNMILSVTNKFKLPLKTFNSEEKAYEWIKKEMQKDA
jgi:hypothetical protein